MSKSARSGLSSVKRDWNDLPSSSPEVLYAWDPTQRPQPQQRTQQQKRSTTVPLTGAQKRLKDIQEALAGLQQPPCSESSSQSKRRSLTDDTSATAPPEKRRRLPPSWDDPLSTPSLSLQSRSSNLTRVTGSSQTVVATPPESKKIASVFLSQEQTRILKLVQDEESVFYTGSAGTGKSVLLREIIKTLRKKHQSPDAVAITASTGIAACNIGGVTIHSFAGIGLGVGSAADLVVRIRRNRKSATRWARTKVLIIDEVSMLDGDLFDKLEEIGRTLRKRQEPFGGIQLIVTGDFFQLPPVAKSSAVKFAFEADTWKQAVKHTFNLTKVFRQSDQTFVDMLNEMRFGNLSKDSISKFYSLSRTINYGDGIGPTELFPRRDDVERSNSNRMKRLDTEMQKYTATDGGSIDDPAQREKLLSNFMAPHQLELKIDAQVMLIKNVDENLVNGTMGRVLRFCDPATFEPEPEFTGAAPESSGSKKVPQSGGVCRRYPVVEFIFTQDRKRRILVMPEIWKVELPSGEVQVSRTQLPLILSWAMSIHKSQGQTLERVKVDLGRVFEKGQAYVALSRATTLDGLQVLNFDPTKVQAHPKVVAWSKTLSTIT